MIYDLSQQIEKGGADIMTPDEEEITPIPIEDFDTSVITDMSSMFAGDTPLDGLEFDEKALRIQNKPTRPERYHSVTAGFSLVYSSTQGSS